MSLNAKLVPCVNRDLKDAKTVCWSHYAPLLSARVSGVCFKGLKIIIIIIDQVKGTRAEVK